MNAAQLIEALKALPPETEVWYWNRCMSYGHEQFSVIGLSSDGELEGDG